MKKSFKKIIGIFLILTMVLGMTSSAFAKENLLLQPDTLTLEEKAIEIVEKMPYTEKIIKQSTKTLNYEELIIKNLKFELGENTEILIIDIDSNNKTNGKMIQINKQLEENGTHTESVLIIPNIETNDGKIINTFKYAEDPIYRYSEPGTETAGVYGTNANHPIYSDLTFSLTVYWERLFSYASYVRAFYGSAKITKNPNLNITHVENLILDLQIYGDIISVDQMVNHNDFTIYNSNKDKTDSEKTSIGNAYFGNTYSTGMLMERNSSTAYYINDRNPLNGHNLSLECDFYYYTSSGQKKHESILWTVLKA